MEYDTPTSEDQISQDTVSEENNISSDPEASAEGSEENLFHILLYEVDENLTEFQFIDSYPDEPTLKDINYNIIHIYNLVLLISFFLIGKWILDKTFTCFNSLWKRW